LNLSFCSLAEYYYALRHSLAAPCAPQYLTIVRVALFAGCTSLRSGERDEVSGLAVKNGIL